MKKIQLDLMRQFITSKLNALMPIEDEVIIEYVFSQLEQSQVNFSIKSKKNIFIFSNFFFKI